MMVFLQFKHLLFADAVCNPKGKKRQQNKNLVSLFVIYFRVLFVKVSNLWTEQINFFLLLPALFGSPLPGGSYVYTYFFCDVKKYNKIFFSSSQSGKRKKSFEKKPIFL